MPPRLSMLLLATAVSSIAAGLVMAATPAAPAGGGGTTTVGPGAAPGGTPAAPGAGRGRGGGGGGRGGRGPQGPEPGVHDPVMIKQADWYYVFYTGGLVNTLRSRDFKTWERLSTVFTQENAPMWTVEIQGQGGRGGGRGGRGGRGGATQPGATQPATQPGIATAPPQTLPGAPAPAGQPRRDYWAPDIALHDGKYFLYYCASSFGQNRSGIGLALNKTLDPASPDYKWEDQGKIIESQSADFYNCIDPNVYFDPDGTAWLTFGSFYWNQGGGRSGAPANPQAATQGGLMMVKLDPATGKILPGEKPKTIASRAFPDRAIEAPTLTKVGDWYYLFASWDRCCAGVNSTYRIMVGRSQKVTGPFLDKDGKDMALGGGTEVLAGDADRIIGPGHQDLMEDGTPGTPGHRFILLYHFYDGQANGQSKLQFRAVTFDTGWPVLGEVINKPAPATAPGGQ